MNATSGGCTEWYIHTYIPRSLQSVTAPYGVMTASGTVGNILVAGAADIHNICIST